MTGAKHRTKCAARIRTLEKGNHKAIHLHGSQL